MASLSYFVILVYVLSLYIRFDIINVWTCSTQSWSLSDIPFLYPKISRKSHQLLIADCAEKNRDRVWSGPSSSSVEVYAALMCRTSFSDPDTRMVKKVKTDG